MQDRFKFRVYVDKNDEYPESTGYVNTEDFYVHPEGDVGFFNADYDFVEYIIEQCTGLKDKNGKLIYEGDIVKCRYYDNFDGTERESIGKVYWNKEDCAFYIFISLEEEIGFYGNSIEVIGNIHENGDLLK